MKIFPTFGKSIELNKHTLNFIMFSCNVAKFVFKYHLLIIMWCITLTVMIVIAEITGIIRLFDSLEVKIITDSKLVLNVR